MNKILTAALAAATLALSAAAIPAAADQRVTLKAAKSGTSYYVMAVQLSEAAKTAAGLDVTVEESQGSVQNVKESKARSGNFVFTTPPGLLATLPAAVRAQVSVARVVEHDQHEVWALRRGLAVAAAISTAASPCGGAFAFAAFAAFASPAAVHFRPERTG